MQHILFITEHERKSGSAEINAMLGPLCLKKRLGDVVSIDKPCFWVLASILNVLMALGLLLLEVSSTSE